MAPRPDRRQFLALSAFAGLSAMSGGCRRKEVPGLADVPPGPPAVPVTYRDNSPRWSHNGLRIAFLRSTADRKFQLFTASPGLSDVQAHLDPMLINPDRAFRTGRAGHLAPDAPVWSPDDREIVFPRMEWFNFDEGDRVPGTALWSLDLPNRSVNPLAVHPRKYADDLYYYRSPAWSPDGARVAFIGESPEGSTVLLIRYTRLFGSIIESAAPDMYRDVGWPTWSPDSKRLLFRHGILRAPTADAIETLRVISPGGTEAGNVFALTPTDYESMGFQTGGPDGPVPAPRFASPTWSPDGRRIAFTLCADALDRSGYVVCILEPGAGRRLTRVSPRDGHGYLSPVWIDPDTLGAIRTAKSGWEVVSLAANGRGEPRLLCNLPSDDFDWSPDRKQIIFASTERVASRGNPRTTLGTVSTGV